MRSIVSLDHLGCAQGSISYPPPFLYHLGTVEIYESEFICVLASSAASVMAIKAPAADQAPPPCPPPSLWLCGVAACVFTTRRFHMT